MSKIIAVDFDGTLCENEYPNIGSPNIDLIEYLKDEQRNGAHIILWTCRTGRKLEEALFWCGRRHLYFDKVNENTVEAIEKHGGDSRKIFADVYIDDRASQQFNLPYKVRRCNNYR